MSVQPVLDVARLPSIAFGHRANLWWGVLGLIAIEGMMFALVGASYFYLWLNFPHWPPAGVPRPDLAAATGDLALHLLSLAPMVRVDRIARQRRRPRAVGGGLLLCGLIGAVALVFRWYAFRATHVEWDVNAYGSVVWLLLGVHAAHLITSVVEVAVTAGPFFTRRLEAKHFVDATASALYWYFVVASWVAVYVIVYLVPHVAGT